MIESNLRHHILAETMAGYCGALTNQLETMLKCWKGIVKLSRGCLSTDEIFLVHQIAGSLKAISLLPLNMGLSSENGISKVAREFCELSCAELLDAVVSYKMDTAYVGLVEVIGRVIDDGKLLHVAAIAAKNGEDYSQQIQQIRNRARSSVRWDGTTDYLVTIREFGCECLGYRSNRTLGKKERRARGNFPTPIRTKNGREEYSLLALFKWYSETGGTRTAAKIPIGFEERRLNEVVGTEIPPPHFVKNKSKKTSPRKKN